MSYDASSDIVRQRVNTWTATAISWEGFNGKAFRPPSGVYWVRPSLVSVSESARYVAIGGDRARVRLQQLLIVEVYGPVGIGETTFVSHTDALLALLDGYTYGGARFRQKGWARRIGLDATGAYWRWNVYSPVEFDYVTSLDAASNTVTSGHNASRKSQAAHGFVPYDWVTFASGSWVKAAAVSGSYIRAEGVVTRVFDVDSFEVVLGGLATTFPTDHPYGSLGALFLTTTAGVASRTQYTSGAGVLDQTLGTAQAPRTIHVAPQPGVEL